MSREQALTMLDELGFTPDNVVDMLVEKIPVELQQRARKATP